MPAKTKVKSKPTGPTKAKQYRLGDRHVAAIARLARRWGPVKPLTEADVIREAIRRAYLAEFGVEP